MTVTKDELKAVGKFKISKIFTNKRNGQMTILIPKRKLKKIPKRLEVTYW